MATTLPGTVTYIQLPADSVGKKVQAWSNVDSNGDTTLTQAAVLTDTGGTPPLVNINGVYHHLMHDPRSRSVLLDIAASLKAILDLMPQEGG